MEKCYRCLIIFIVSFFAFNTFSAAKPQPSILNPASPTKTSAIPTDITIVNAAYDVIYLNVPAKGLRATIFSGETYPISDKRYFEEVHIILQNPQHKIFFNKQVCHHAIVSVYGGPGDYSVDVDTRYCY